MLLARMRSPCGHDHAFYTIVGLSPNKSAFVQHVVHVRQHLAECEAHLVGVERMMKDHRNELGGRARRRAAGGRNGGATGLMMGDELVAARRSEERRGGR